MPSSESPSPRPNILSNISVLLLFVVALAVPGASAQTSVTDPAATGQNFPTATSQQDNPQLHAIASEIERGDYKQAESDARAYLLREPDSSAGHNLFGYVLYRENRPKDSLAEYTSGARFHKPDANDLAVVAMDYVLLADYPAADKWLTEATKLEPQNALYWYYLGRTKYNENRFQEALTAFRRALLLKPRDIRSEYNLGLAFSGLGLTSEAEAAYKAAIAWEKAQARVDPQPYLDLGLLLVQQGKNAQATAYLMTAVELDAANPKAHEALGHNYEQLMELSKAEAEYKAAVRLAPNISALHFELGRVYRKENQIGPAKQEFARCAALNRSHSTDSEQTPNTGRGHRP